MCKMYNTCIPYTRVHAVLDKDGKALMLFMMQLLPAGKASIQTRLNVIGVIV